MSDFNSSELTIKITDLRTNPLFAEDESGGNAPYGAIAPQHVKENNSIYQLLNSTYRGRCVLRGYEMDVERCRPDSTQSIMDLSEELSKSDCEESDLSEHFDRHLLCSLIVDHEFDRRGYYISKDRFSALAQEIVEIFPNDSPDRYYAGSMKGKNGNAPVSAKGILYNKYKRLRVEAIKLGFLKMMPQMNKRKKPEDDVETELIQQFKHLTDIDSDYKEIWNQTINERHAFFETQTLDAIFEAFPALQSPKGLELLDNDFRHSGDGDKLVNRWCKIAKAIIIIAKTKKSKDVAQVLKANRPLTSEDHIQTVALMLLPHLMGAQQCVTSRNKRIGAWKANGKEVSDSFILISQEPYESDEIEEIELNKKEDELKLLYTKHQLPLPGYIVVYGCPTKIRKTKIVLGKYEYTTHGPDSLVIAVDKYFKSIHVLKKNFSKASVAVWQFLQTYVYEQKAQSLYSSVVQLTSTLQIIKM